MKVIYTLAMIVLLASCSAHKSNYVKYQKLAPSSVKKELLLDLQSAGKVSYLGQVEGANSQNANTGMLYPGYTAGTFLASILTHAIVADSVKNSEKNAQQEKANEILLPFNGLLEGIKLPLLLDKQVAIKQQFSIVQTDLDSSLDTKKWLVRINPVYYVKQDFSLLTLKNAISVYEADNQKKPIYQNLVEVVQAAKGANEQEQQAYLMDNGGQALKSISSKLLADSLLLFKADLYSEFGSVGKDKTFRFKLGEQSIVERGKLIREDCEQTVIRTLRGWLKSVPTKLNANSELGCQVAS